MLPFLERESRRGRALHLVWMTDGAAGGTPLTRRAEESRAVLARNGLEGVACIFLGLDHALPDGRLHEHVERAYRALSEVLDRVDTPIELWLPAWEGGHQDHDTTHALGRAAGLGRDALMRQYPTYHGEGRRGPLFRVLTPLSGSEVVDRISLGLSDALRLLATCTQYRSQWRSFVGLLPMMAMHLVVFRRPMVLCAVDAKAPFERPHPGALLYERRTAWRWEDLRSALGGLAR